MARSRRTSARSAGKCPSELSQTTSETNKATTSDPKQSEGEGPAVHHPLHPIAMKPPPPPLVSQVLRPIQTQRWHPDRGEGKWRYVLFIIHCIQSRRKRHP